MNQRNVTFTLMTTETDTEHFLLLRNVNDYTTHWMDPDGKWQPFPEEEDDLAQLFVNLAEPGALPRIDPND
jgi:hypothetical protein